MLITSYENYKGGINNLIVVKEWKNSGIVGTSTKSEAQAIKNFKRNYKKYTGKTYQEA